MEKLRANEILSLFQDYFIRMINNKTLQKEIEDIFSQNPPFSSVDDFADKYEKDLDNFIHNLAKISNNDREQTQSIIKVIDKNILCAFFIRWTTITALLQKNLQKSYPISTDSKQFIVDYMINYWREYRHPGVVKFFP